MSAFVFGNKSFGQNDSKLNLQIYHNIHTHSVRHPDNYNVTSRVVKLNKEDVEAHECLYTISLLVLTYILIVKVVSSGETDEQWLVPVFAHELV